MRARLMQAWERLRSSLWFVPALMVAGAGALAFAAVALDGRVKDRTLAGYWWVFGGGAEGARAVLSTIAGSVMTVAGVAFSITVAVLTLASSQFGPRLLRGFLRDTGSQVALGTFLGTFLYCLLVLRTVRSVDEGTFVPALAVTLGLALAVVSLGVLVYFIHHTAASIQAAHIIAVAGRDLDDAVERLFPARVGRGGEPGGAAGQAPLRDAGGCEIAAEAEGYVQAVDGDALLAAARDADVVLRLCAEPGAFVARGDALAFACPPPPSPDALARAVRRAFVLGPHRTPGQDVLFAVQQLVEVAARALSPGINDPFTAVACIDRLGAALGRLAERDAPPALRRDDRGRLRVAAEPVTFADALGAAFGPLREYGGGASLVALRLLDALSRLAERADRPEDRAALARHAARIAEAARGRLTDPACRAEVEARYREAAARLTATAAGTGVPDGATPCGAGDTDDAD